MMWVGEHLLAYNRIHSPDEIERQLASVTSAAIQEVAAELFRDSRLNAAVISPNDQERTVTELLSFA